jgi:hypothetical protein
MIDARHAAYTACILSVVSVALTVYSASMLIRQMNDIGMELIVDIDEFGSLEQQVWNEYRGKRVRTTNNRYRRQSNNATNNCRM